MKKPPPEHEALVNDELTSLYYQLHLVNLAISITAEEKDRDALGRLYERKRALQAAINAQTSRPSKINSGRGHWND